MSKIKDFIIKKHNAVPTITIHVDRETRQLDIKIENFEGVPAIALDRIDVAIEKELYRYNTKARQEAAEAYRQSDAA